MRQLVIVEQIADGVGVDAEGAASFLHLVRRALVADLIERLAAAREYAHEERDRACWRDGKKRAVPQAVLFDLGVDLGRFLGETLDERRFLRLFPVVFAEGALFLGEGGGSACGFREHGAQHALDEVAALAASVGELHGDEGVGDAEEPESDAAPIADALTVFFQRLRVEAVVEHFVERTNRRPDSGAELLFCKMRRIAELVLDEGIEVEAHEVA